MAYNSWTGMSGYVQRLKEEADRKEEEKRRQQQLQSWRRDVPVGPPTREQAQQLGLISPTPEPKPQIGPITKEQAVARGYTPKPQPKIDLAKPVTPSFQVGYTEPGVSTATPEIEETRRPSPTATYAQVQQPTAQPQQPATPSFGSSLANWRLPLASAQPTAALAAPQIAEALSPYVSPYLNQGVNALRLGAATGLFGPNWQNIVNSMAEPNLSTPMGALTNLTKQMVEQREKERQAYEIAPWQGPSLTSSLLAPLNPVAAIKENVPGIAQGAQQVGKFLNNIGLYKGGAYLMDTMQFIDEISGILPVPGTGKTAGQLWAQIQQVDDYTATQNIPERLDPNQFLPGANIQPGTWQDKAFQQTMDVLAFANPQTWQNVNNITEYWDMANKDILAAITPTNAQMKNTTQQQRDEAKALALVLMTSGVNAAAAAYDDYLDNPVKANEIAQQAIQMASQADLQPNPVVRNAMLSEAGRMGGQALKLRETLPIDLYNTHKNFWYSMPFEAAFGLTNAPGWVSDLAKVTPMQRRYAQATALAGAQPGVTTGKNLTTMIKESPVYKWLETNTSKAMGDAYTNFKVGGNLLSGVETKADIGRVLTGFFEGTLGNGISVAELNSPTATMQASNGIYNFGWSGLNDYRAVNAQKSLAGMSKWVASMPSLAGDGNEIANKVEVMNDLASMLVRGAAQHYNVSKLQDVPWGTTTFNVVSQAGNKAVVEFVDSMKNVVGQTQVMSVAAANNFAHNAKNAVKKGQEFKTNYLKAIGDFERSILSAYTLNSVPASIIANGIGGNAMGAIDQAFNGNLLHPKAKQIEYLANKLGGFFPNLRIAEGVGGVVPTGTTFGNQAVPTSLGGWGQKILNISTFGLAEAGKRIRQGAGVVPGTGGTIKAGEESIATSIYYSAFKSFMDQELPARVKPVVDDILKQYGVNSPQTAKWITDQIVSAGLAGGRIDVARTFNDIVNGKITPTLRSFSPAFEEIFAHDEVLEINNLFKQLDDTTLPLVQQRLNQIIDARLALTDQELANYAFQPGRRTFTDMDDGADVADIVNMYEYAATMAGKPLEEAQELGRKVANTQQAINQQLFGLLRMAERTPVLANYIYDVWRTIIVEKDNVRRLLAEASKAIRDTPGALRYQDVAATAPEVPTEQVNRLVAQLTQQGTPITFDEARRMIVEAMGPVQGAAIPPQAGATKNELWEQYRVSVQASWDDFGQRARQMMEQARENILSGEALRALQREPGFIGPTIAPPTQTIGQAQDFLGDLSNDIVKGLEFTKQKLNSWDPTFEVADTAMRKAVDSAQAKMVVALSRYPTMTGFDAYQDAYTDVAREVRNILKQINPLQEQVDKIRDGLLKVSPQEERRLRAELNKAKQQWSKYYEYAINRFLIGAQEVVAANMPEEALQLGFQFGNEQWFLRGPVPGNTKQWKVLSPAGQRGVLPEGIAGVPTQTIEKWKALALQAEREIAEQVGRISMVAASENRRGAVGVDPLLQVMGTKEYKELYTAVRKSVQERMAAFNADPVLLNGESVQWQRERLETVRQLLNSELARIAQLNQQGFGRMDMGAINDFNKKVLPLWDNIVSGAQRYGDEMMSFSVLDYTRQYHPDILLSLLVPYHFFFTRMGKNTVERQLFNPGFQNHILRYIRSVERENRADNQPNRNIQSIPGSGPTIGDTSYRVNSSFLPRWIPMLPLYVMNGWADPDRANRGYEMALDQATQSTFPLSAKGWVGNAIYLNELMKQAGMTPYPWVDQGLALAAGQPFEWKGSLAQMSPLYRTLGWGGVRFANWAHENGIEWLEKPLDFAVAAATPDYTPYLYGREASFEAARGNLTDPQAEMVQDVAHQDWSGRGPLPEQQLLNPQAEAQYRAIQNKVSMEYFVKNLITFMTGIPIATVYEPEMKLREAKEMYANVQYDEQRNPAGSREAAYAMEDPTSKFFTPGLGSFRNQYVVTGESAPNVPLPEEDRPGMKAVKQEFFRTREEIYAKYREEQEQAYKDHPEWKLTENYEEKDAFDDDLRARQDAEIDALKAQFPSMAQDEETEPGAGTPTSVLASATAPSTGPYVAPQTEKQKAAAAEAPVAEATAEPVEEEYDPNRGKRPSELVAELEVDLYQRAKEQAEKLKPGEAKLPYPGDNPNATDEEWDAFNAENEAIDKGWDAYNKAIENNLAKLMKETTLPKNGEWTGTPAEIAERERHKYEAPAKVETDKAVEEASDLNREERKQVSAWWDEYFSLENNDQKAEYLRTHPEFAALYVANEKKKGRSGARWWLGEGGGGRSARGASAWSQNWEEYSALGDDFAAKAEYMRNHPEFAAYYKDRYQNAWWEEYTPRGARTPRTFTPYSFSYGGGGGDGPGMHSYERQYVRQLEAQRLETPQFQAPPLGPSDDWRRYNDLAEVNLRGWRR